MSRDYVISKEEYTNLLNLPLDKKIEKSKERICEWYNHFNGQIFVAFSGGKDSTVLLHLVRSLYPEVVAVFYNTGLEYPDIYKFVQSFDNVVVMKPKMKFREVIDKYGWVFPSKEVASVLYYAKQGKSWALSRMDGFKSNGEISLYGEHYRRYKYLIDSPFNISPMCCTIMKKNLGSQFEKDTGKHPITGTLASESLLRRQQYLRTGCNGYDATHPSSKPLSFWTDQDILQYILDNNIKIASCYGDIIKDKKGKLTTSGLKRTGCMFCLIGVNREKRPNRFELMKQNYPQYYKYCMETLGLNEILSWLKVPH